MTPAKEPRLDVRPLRVGDRVRHRVTGYAGSVTFKEGPSISVLWDWSGGASGRYAAADLDLIEQDGGE